jgi:hypothetical protein
VHQRRALWDRGDLEHLNPNMLNKLWGEVAQELNTKCYAVRGKWKSLRDGFITRLRKMPVRISGDAALEISHCRTWPHFEPLYFLRDQYKPQASSGGIPPEEKKTLREEQTHTLDGEFETSQYSGSGKELKPSAKVLKRRSGDDGLELSGHSTFPECKRLCFRKDLYTPHASSGGIPPGEKKTLREEQTDTRDGEFESSKLIIADDAPEDILDVKTEDSGPLSPNKRPAALSTKLHTNKHSTRRLYQTDIGNAPAQIETPMLTVRGDEHKARDEDTSFFECLIPHIKGLSPERKILLRIKTLELINNFVYTHNQGFQIQQYPIPPPEIVEQ